MRFCKDCRFVVWVEDRDPVCARTAILNNRRDPVTGEVDTRASPNARAERVADSSRLRWVRRCGPDGLLFEPATPSDYGESDLVERGEKLGARYDTRTVLWVD